MASMEPAIQGTREFPGNQDHRGIPGKWETRVFQGSAISPCAIRRTTSGTVTARDPMSDVRSGVGDTLSLILLTSALTYDRGSLEDSCMGGRDHLRLC